MKAAIYLGQKAFWNLESIITQEFPLEEISKAIQTAANPSRAFNAAIRF